MYSSWTIALACDFMRACTIVKSYAPTMRLGLNHVDWLILSQLWVYQHIYLLSHWWVDSIAWGVMRACWVYIGGCGWSFIHTYWGNAHRLPKSEHKRHKNKYISSNWFTAILAKVSEHMRHLIPHKFCTFRQFPHDIRIL